MRYSNYRFTLDLQKHQSQMSIAVFKNDTAVRLRISLTDGGKSYFIDDGCIAKFFATRSDDKELIHNCMIEGNTEIVYDFQPSTSCREGITNCQIRLYGLDGLLIAAPRFIIVVDERVVIDELVDLPEDNLSGIDAMISAEVVRVANETNRVNAEAIRVANEDNRAESEEIRITNEANRQNAESGRAANELARIENEVARQQAESNRGKRLTALEGNAVLKNTDVTQTIRSVINFIKAVYVDCIYGSRAELSDAYIDGVLEVAGDLVVGGKTTTVQHETIVVRDNIIVTNSDGLNITASGLVINKGNGKAYGILYQPQGDLVFIGEGTYSVSGGIPYFDFDEGQALPLAARSENFPDGDIPVFDADKSAFVSSGKSPSSFVEKTNQTSQRVAYTNNAGTDEVMRVVFNVSGSRIGYYSIACRNLEGCLTVNDPINPLDAVNKRTLDAVVGNIETALDNVISIQESLIGGNA